MGQVFVQSIGLTKRRTLISMPNQILVEVFLPKTNSANSLILNCLNNLHLYKVGGGGEAGGHIRFDV